MAFASWQRATSGQHTLRNCEATLLRASAGHSLNQSIVQQFTRLGNLRKRALQSVDKADVKLLSFGTSHSGQLNLPI